jgi:hypothetical protein
MIIACWIPKATNTNSEYVIPNLINAKLNPICHLLALLGAHHIFHVSMLSDNAFAWQQ